MLPVCKKLAKGDSILVRYSIHKAPKEMIPEAPLVRNHLLGGLYEVGGKWGGGAFHPSPLGLGQTLTQGRNVELLFQCVCVCVKVLNGGYGLGWYNVPSPQIGPEHITICLTTRTPTDPKPDPPEAWFGGGGSWRGPALLRGAGGGDGLLLLQLGPEHVGAAAAQHDGVHPLHLVPVLVLRRTEGQRGPPPKRDTKRKHPKQEKSKAITIFCCRNHNNFYRKVQSNTKKNIFVSLPKMGGLP